MEKLDDRVGFVGLSNVYREDTHWMRRILWGGLVVMGFGFMIMHLHDRIHTYFKKETVTRISAEVLHHAILPQVTVCLEITTDSFNMSNEPTRDMFTRNTPPLSHVINSSLIGFQHDTRDGWELDSAEERVCYSFNKAGSFAVTTAGHYQGLHIVLNDANILSTVPKRPDATLGFIISINNPGHLPSVLTGPIYIALGWRTSIELRMVRYKYKQNCQEKNLGIGLPYSISHCQMDCLVRYAQMFCDCTPPAMAMANQKYFSADLSAMANTYPFCTTSQMNICIVNGTITNKDGYKREESPYVITLENPYQIKETASFLDECRCGVPCNQLKYERSVSQSQLPDNSQTYLDVYYETLTATQIEQVFAYTWLSLMADLGGATGLFLGASLLTIVQLLEFTLETILQNVKKQGKHNQNT